VIALTGQVYRPDPVWNFTRGRGATSPLPLVRSITPAASNAGGGLRLLLIHLFSLTGFFLIASIFELFYRAIEYFFPIAVDSGAVLGALF
jgi:hypothetical protein